ncbi:hypothetical protein Snoj_56480 [Streptomyces nojiriensis]|uniref:Uncharacterized protein n=1 Tax=Streptomyces nojiriensis TaxID=66374 RepID=A0ABQ3SVC4_9ACTN|nr:hypothetical protein GCM10010205_24010 [Streptomyces nojiriensis]GHI71730.1 hypothetical protein Snoj_56480 [Streptomyces nojiriensis]
MMLKLNTGVKPRSVGQGAIGTERPGVCQGSLRLGGALVARARTKRTCAGQDTAAEGLAGLPLSAACLRAPAGVTQQYVDGPAKSYSPSAPNRVRDARDGPE